MNEPLDRDQRRLPDMPARRQQPEELLRPVDVDHIGLELRHDSLAGLDGSGCRLGLMLPGALKWNSVMNGPVDLLPANEFALDTRGDPQVDFPRPVQCIGQGMHPTAIDGRRDAQPPGKLRHDKSCEPEDFHFRLLRRRAISLHTALPRAVARCHPFMASNSAFCAVTSTGRSANSYQLQTGRV